MDCRIGCGACCIAISISSPIPGMPAGKAAGVRCVQLTAANTCALFGLPERPRVCAEIRPSPDLCGSSYEKACAIIAAMEEATRPGAQAAGRLPRSTDRGSGPPPRGRALPRSAG